MSEQTRDDRPPVAPRWVKVLAVVVLLAALVMAVALLVGGGHGPGRHAPSAAVSPVTSSVGPS